MKSDPKFCGRCKFYFPNMDDGSMGTCFLEVKSDKIPASRVGCRKFEMAGEDRED